MEQQNRLQEKENKLVSLKDASDWGSHFVEVEQR